MPRRVASGSLQPAKARAPNAGIREESVANSNPQFGPQRFDVAGLIVSARGDAPRGKPVVGAQVWRACTVRAPLATHHKDWRAGAVVAQPANAPGFAHLTQIDPGTRVPVSSGPGLTIPGSQRCPGLQFTLEEPTRNGLPFTDISPPSSKGALPSAPAP